MAKNNPQFSKSEEWLKWLNDDALPDSYSSAQARTIEEKGAYRTQGLYRQQSSHAVKSRQMHTFPRRSLGLDAQSFRRAPTAPKETITPDEPNLDKKITIQFRLPQIRFPKRKAVRVSTARKKNIVGGLVIVGIIFSIVFTPIFVRKASQDAAKRAENESLAKPAYAPLLPNMRNDTTEGVVNSANETPQYTSKYIPSKQLFQFKDTYKGVEIIVTEQPLPEKLKSNPDAVKVSASEIGATEYIDTTEGKLYASPSNAATSQRLIYASKQLLITIMAVGVLKDSDWVMYVQNLSSN